MRETNSFHKLYDGPKNRGASSQGITSYFGELRDPCVKFITESQIIVGCVAWLTDPDMINALAGRFIALVVQKENWWKKGDARGTKLANGYMQFTGGLPASAFPDPLKSYGATELAPIACMGTTGGGNGYGNPLMHHKFLIRCAAIDGVLVPQAVWTGSFNLSVNANGSFENATVVENPIIAESYLQEFALVAALSEPMNWSSGQPKPGTLGKWLTAPRARKSR